MFKYMESEQLAYVMITTYGIMLVSYFCTSLLDPGIIKPSEDNSIENKPVQEPLGYTYCSICEVYRPPGSYHCQDCGACFYKFVFFSELSLVDMITIARSWGRFLFPLLPVGSALLRIILYLSTSS